MYDWDGDDNEVNESTMLPAKAIFGGDEVDAESLHRQEKHLSAARGRMAGAEIDADGAGSSSAAETTTTYTYDDHGFRIRQSTTHDSTTVVTEFVPDAANPTG